MLDFDELLDELDAIVYSGTRLNINYFIEEVLDPECVDEIFDYFRTADTDDIDKAVLYFDNEYSEEEIRLIRVKFISEMAN